MSYRAKEHYQDAAVVAAYDRRRFSSLKGRLVDWREKQLILDSMRRAGLAPPAALLDVPSGTGRLSITLASLGYSVTGADVSAAMVSFATARARAMRGFAPPEFVVGDAERLPFADRSFDAVVCLRLLGHLSAPVRLAVLREFARVTRRFVVVAFYDRAALQGRLRAGARKGAWNPVDVAELPVEVERAGLRIVARHFLVRWVSETVVVTAERA